MVAFDAVAAVKHLEREFLRTPEVDREVLWACKAVDGTRVGYDLAVKEYLELHGSIEPLVVHGIVGVET